MELLVRVAETGSMTLAARQMRLTPAAVSAAVRRVEADIGVRVFERTTRSVHATDEGVVVLGACQELVERWQQTLEVVRGAEQELSGTVHLSAPADTTYQMLGPLVVGVSADHPNLRIVVHTSDELHHLHRDAIDMAIRYGPLADSALSARKLAKCPLVLVAASTYLEENGVPGTPEVLESHRCLTLQLSGVPVASWTLHGNGSVREVTLGSPLCGDGYLARKWALAGMGIALKSLFDVVDDLEEGRLVQVLPDYTGRPMPIHAVFPSRRFLAARVRAIEAAIASEFAARAARCEAWLLRRERME